jgi:hypothetical protein
LNRSSSSDQAFIYEVTVTDSWQQFVAPLLQFHSAASPGSFDTKAISDFDFKIASVAPVDLWIDDLALACP